MHCMRQLRARVSVWRAGGVCGPADHDEVRHVLRPFECGKETDVRDRVSQSGALLRDPGADRATAADVTTGEHLSFRETKHHYPCVRHDACTKNDVAVVSRYH